MKSRQKIKRILLSVTAVFSAVLLLMSAHVFADDVFTDDFGNTVQWWNFRNTLTNNAVTGRPTPTNDKEAWGKWAAKYGTGWAASPTPPIIVNDRLYIGVGNKIIEVDKETGTALRYSEEMPGNVGYAMQSPVYADGKIFIAITNGRVSAINISDLSLAWTTDNSDIIKGQTVSPISYVKIGDTGYIYTGTWTKAGGDLICASTDDTNVTVNEEGIKIKALTWHFNPQIIDAANLEAHSSVALGYYWTGAYVTDKYLAIGSDNGSTLGDYVNDTAFYTLDPRTGEIIDAAYGIKGQVRSTAVYENGYLYFSTKGAKIYKIAVDENGNLGEPSYIDMNEYGALMATATPVVYGGKIYLGVQGRGNQFSADGGHGFVVARDDAALSQDSFVYNIPVPGYPQAGALLSDYHVAEDFDGDEQPDGRVYLFFTYNAPPGGIFYTYDTPEQTQPTALSVEEAKIFVPAVSQQQYCISSIVVDTDSTLYYKNDSGYLFAVETNPAILNDLRVIDENGEAIELHQPFQSKMADYRCTTATDASRITIELDLEEGVAASVNGAAYTAPGIEVLLEEDLTQIEITTNKEGKARTYHLEVNKASVNADLSSLGSAINNTAPGTNNPNTRAISPEFDKDVMEYTFDWITTGTGNTTSPIDPATKDMMNIFLKTDSEKAKVAVFPEENTQQPEYTLNEDGSIKAYNVSGSVYAYRYPVYSADITRDSTARIVVTAEDGMTTKEYHVTFSRRIYAAEVMLNTDKAELTEGDELQLEGSLIPENATDPSLKWSSSDAAVAEVDENGKITAKAAGEAVITAASADGPYARCEVTVKHKLIKTEAKAPTVEEDGNIEYWTCEICGQLFADEAALIPITAQETIVPFAGWKERLGVWYYYQDGIPAKGWQKIKGAWYYLDPQTGAMQTDWRYIGGKWYYMDPSGVMQTGWRSVGGKWYYMNPSGAMQIGWQRIGGTWYYMDYSSGIMQTGWQRIGGTWYCFKSSGAMAANEWYGGYWLSVTGAWTYPYQGSWKKDGWGWWFGDTSGWYAKNETLRINDKYYTFDASGYLK